MTSDEIVLLIKMMNDVRDTTPYQYMHCVHPF